MYKITLHRSLAMKDKREDRKGFMNKNGIWEVRMTDAYELRRKN